MATAVLIGSGACAKGPEAAPRPAPTTKSASTTRVANTTPTDPGRVEQCLTQGIEERSPNPQYIIIDTTGTPECTSYVDKMYRALSATALYGPYLSSTEQVFGESPTRAGRFQLSSGLEMSRAFDTVTVQTMRHELDRLAQPPATCGSDGEPSSWSREILVDRLASMGAFTISADGISAARTDLLNPDLSKDNLIRETSELTEWATCNNVRFNVLDVNTGHSTTTLSGNTSYHVLGRAIDIRPYNGDQPMPAWSQQYGDDPLLPEQRIANNPQAADAARKILEFLNTRASHIQEEIWTDGATSITNGVAVPNFSHGFDVDEVHHDHIHFGVK